MWLSTQWGSPFDLFMKTRLGSLILLCISSVLCTYLSTYLSVSCNALALREVDKAIVTLLFEEVRSVEKEEIVLKRTLSWKPNHGVRCGAIP